jgi:hypothetical protein
MRVRVVRGTEWFLRYMVEKQLSPGGNWLPHSSHHTYWGALREAMQLKCGKHVVAEV